MIEPLASPVAGKSRAAFAFIFVTVVLDFLAFGVMIPVLPKLVIQFQGGDTARAATVYGLFSTAWAVMQFLCSPLVGSLSDRFGRRPVVLLSNLGLGLDYLVMALAPNLAWLFAGRLISGITSSSYPTAGAYIADVTPPEKRAASFGKLGAAFGIGFIVGPALGGVLGGIDLRLPFWVAAGLSLANFCYGFFILPESLARERRTPFAWRRANPLGSLKLLRSHPELSGLAAATLLHLLAHDSLPSTFVLYTDYRYGWGATSLGLCLAAVGLCSMIVQAGLVGPAVRRFHERRTLAAGLILGAAGFLITGLAPTGALFMIAVPFLSLYGLAGPSIQGLMSRRIGPSEQGQLQGAISSIMGLAGIIAPVVFTQLFAAAIGPHLGWHLPGAPFFLAAALLVGALVIAWRVTRNSVAAPVTVPAASGETVG